MANSYTACRRLIGTPASSPISLHSTFFDNTAAGFASSSWGMAFSTPPALRHSKMRRASTLSTAPSYLIVVEDQNIKTRNPQWQSTLPFGLSGRTLGLVGVGHLGSGIAKIAKVFNLDVFGWSLHLTPERAAAAGVTYIATKEELIRKSDIVSIHLVLSPSTYHIISSSDLALLKPSAFIINTSRGDLIDEDALVEVLREGKIAGAGLDAFSVEPLPLDHPIRGLKNATLSPHSAYLSDTSFEVFYRETVENIVAFLDGNPIRVYQ